MARQAKRLPQPVSSKPLFEWFERDRANRAKLRTAGYSDGQITNWKERGIPRAQLDSIASIMGINTEDYLVRAGEAPPSVRQTGAEYRSASDEAMEIARAFDRMQPQTKERVREHVFLMSIVDRSFPWLRTGKPMSDNYTKFEKWHEENMAANLALEAARITKLKEKT